MINFFLRAKHWQLFMLAFGVPILIQIFMIMGGIFSVATDTDFLVFSYATVFPIMMILNIGTLFGWFWSVATGIQHQVPPQIKMSVTKFKIFFFVPVMYLVCILIVLGFLMGGEFNDDKSTLAGFIGLFILLHLISMFCIFYCLYFVAKTLRTVELQREVFFHDFAGDFFLIWFYPIGFWIIQPRVNKLFEG